MKKVTFEKNGTKYLDVSREYLKEIGFDISEIDNIFNNAELVEIKENRLSAYQNESDPLFLEWQYDNTPEKEQAWRDKVAEIKARYPLPSES
ncbi:hypothetical protein HJ001_23130 [Vibrio parahaemolyticus]|nr:hypothetical protein [Vibrio parahaemolyticus]MBE4530568.1 hypothetical protein [Vibrio parahaemolyticus]HAV1337884.1 hypothetical protein [Vibrio parahaemolyticus]HAV1421209.1 hypothetical protein [Vibrio parahaemolyticus]HAV1545401.1 hypothetical protein [Vibrio parahaemolyticus]